MKTIPDTVEDLTADELRALLKMTMSVQRRDLIEVRRASLVARWKEASDQEIVLADTLVDLSAALQTGGTAAWDAYKAADARARTLGRKIDRLWQQIRQCDAAMEALRG